MRAAGLAAVPYHNHVPTLGEWGWVVGLRTGRGAGGSDALKPADRVRSRLAGLDFAAVETRFLNPEAMLSMLNFGKGTFDDIDEIEASGESDLAVFYYYRDSDWDLY